MNFVGLPDFFPSHFLGVNSPIILRAEAGCDAGGMTVEEFRNTVPHVHLYGDTRAARDCFANALCKLKAYADTDLVTIPPPSAGPAFFQFEIRQPDYHVRLWGDQDHYDATMVAAPGIKRWGQYRQDFHDSHIRLKALYERFFDTVL